MSIKIIFNVIAQCPHKPSEKMMLTILADFANDKGYCYPSFETLARLCNVSTRQAQNIIYKLIAQGDIAVNRKEGTSNCYQFLRYLTHPATATHEAHFVPPPTKFEATHAISDNDPRNPLRDTHETHFVTPTKPISSEPVIEPAKEPVTIKPKSIVPPDGADIAPNPVAVNHPTATVASDTVIIPTRQTSVDVTTIEDIATELVDPTTTDQGDPQKHKKSRTDHQRMMDAIVTAFGWTFAKMTKSNKALVGKVAKELRVAGGTPDDIPDLYDFCQSQNWRSKFTPMALSTQWANFIAQRAEADNRPHTQPWVKPDWYIPVKFDYPKPVSELTEEEKRAEIEQVWGIPKDVPLTREIATEVMNKLKAIIRDRNQQIEDFEQHLSDDDTEGIAF